MSRTLLSPARKMLSSPALTLTLAAVPATLGAGGGAIVITDHMLNPALSSFQSDLKSEAKSSSAQNPDTESWKVHFVAHLKKSLARQTSTSSSRDRPAAKTGHQAGRRRCA